MAEDFDSNSGWFRGARHLASPNFDLRPPALAIDLIVIHAISLPAGEFGGPYVEDLFLNRLDHCAHADFDELTDLRVSAHLYISRFGQLTQFVSTLARAWHCGVSQWHERNACNDFSIGIELEGCDDQAFTAPQYARLNSVLQALLAQHKTISPSAIVGHSDIAPGRKTDPGPCFDWGLLRENLVATDKLPQ